jgi:hypothetical protein
MIADQSFAHCGTSVGYSTILIFTPKKLSFFFLIFTQMIVKLIHPLSGTMPSYTTSSQLPASLLSTAFYSNFHKHAINPFRSPPLFSRISMLPNSAGVHTIQDGNGNSYKISSAEYVKGSAERIGAKYFLSPVTGVGNAGKRVKRNMAYLHEVLECLGSEKGVGKVVPVYDLNVALEYQIKGIEEKGGRDEVLADGAAVIVRQMEECLFSEGADVDLSQFSKLEHEFLYVLGICDFGGLVSCLGQAMKGQIMYIDTSAFLDRLVNDGIAINLALDKGMRFILIFRYPDL